MADVYAAFGEEILDVSKRKWIFYVYPVHVMTRKFLGDMMRKLSVTELESRPVSGDFLTQEPKRRIGELGASRVGFIVRDMLVHHAP